MRPDQDRYFVDMLKLVGTRSTCARRQVGCILVNEKNHITATGYNGVPSGFPHCTDTPCPGALAPSGEGLDLCLAIHAEQNALLQCKDVYSIKTAYVTAFPCIHCLKLLMNTSCERIVYIENYPGQVENVLLWIKSGTMRTVEQGGMEMKKCRGCEKLFNLEDLFLDERCIDCTKEEPF